MFQVTYVNPGDKLWFVVKGQHYNSTHYRGDIIVPVVAQEVDDIYSNPNATDKSFWRYRNIDGSDYVSVTSGQVDENGWDIWEKKDPSILGDSKRVNQFVWIDEPVGHAIQVGDTWDGLFLTLAEAQRYAVPSKKKHLKRRLNFYRWKVHDFVASTWERNRATHPGFDKLPEKKIYVRKK